MDICHSDSGCVKKEANKHIKKFKMKFSCGSIFVAIGALLLSRACAALSNNVEFQTPLMYIYNIYIKDVAMVRHTIVSVNVTSPVACFRHCAKVCGCVAFQVTGTSCELLDSQRDSAEEDVVTRQGTLLYAMQQTGIEVNKSCLNECCKSQPCLNGGSCVEKCDDVKQQYICACPKDYQGKRCEVFYPRVKSCQGVIRVKPDSLSSIYNLFISSNKTIQTYCDFSSEAGKAWTLIESFSLENKEFYKDKPFYHDHPRNEDNFTWNNFRVSHQALVNIRDNSTHWRVTCNFPSGLSYSDYARASLTATDLLTFVNEDRCQKYEYVSVRGINCTDCRGMLVQRDNQHMHTDSFWSVLNGCDWNATEGAVRNEDNFGLYDITNPKHKCTETSLSTTQWWLGANL